MALATQCPHCHTTFRVAHDQLKLRAGLVRCGACKQIFNGIENLLRPEELEQANRPAPILQPVPAQTMPPPELPHDAVETTSSAFESNASDTQPVAQQHEPLGEENVAPPSAPADLTSSPVQEAPPDPLLRMTLMDFTHAQHKPVDDDDAAPTPSNPDELDPLDQAIDDLQSKPWRSEQESDVSVDIDELDRAESAEYEEPTFVKQGRRRQRLGKATRILMTTGSILLLTGLIVQGAYVFRGQIAAWFPQTKPLLVQACTYIGCQVGLPEQIDTVSIESSELQALAANANTFTLTVLLRNHDTTVQAWPHIELTLNDTNEKAIARRVFLPRDYLGSVQDVQKGFGPKSEQPVKLHFELAQLKASGYRVYLFYP